MTEFSTLDDIKEFDEKSAAMTLEHSVVKDAEGHKISGSGNTVNLTCKGQETTEITGPIANEIHDKLLGEFPVFSISRGERSAVTLTETGTIDGQQTSATLTVAVGPLPSPIGEFCQSMQLSELAAPDTPQGTAKPLSRA